jgi:hypothetical protein
MHRRIGRRLGAVAIFAGAVAAVSPAVALASPGAGTAVLAHGSLRSVVRPDQPQHPGFATMPAYSGPSFNICLQNATQPKYCLQSNGVGQQVTITSDSANWSNFTKQAISAGEVFNFENGNGNCLRENNSQEVVIANGPCVSSDRDGQWVWPLETSQNFTGVFENNAHPSDEMLVHGNQDEYKVYAKSPVTGDWVKWAPPGIPPS